MTTAELHSARPIILAMGFGEQRTPVVLALPMIVDPLQRQFAFSRPGDAYLAGQRLIEITNAAPAFSIMLHAPGGGNVL
jgi:hypothetical protein